MLACVTDCNDISQHPVNNSNTKQLFSFPKGPRFLHYNKGYNRELSYEAKTAFRREKVFGKSNGFGHAERPEIFP